MEPESQPLPPCRFDKAYNLSKTLVQAIYVMSKAFPESEDMVMSPEIRIAVQDMCKAILMAKESDDREAFRSYVNEAICKSARLDTYVRIAYDLGYIEQETHDMIASQIKEVRELVDIPAKPELTLVESA